MMADHINHQDLYKQIGSSGILSIPSLRHAVGSSVRHEQSRQRQNVICGRRFKVQTACFEEESYLSELEDEELVRSKVKLLKEGQRIQALVSLSNAFARQAKNADLFLRCDGFQSLLSCFRSSNVEVLQAAAWCIVNLTAGISSSEPLMVAASTLLQFLNSSDLQMQELCAWAIGNLAGDSTTNVIVLKSQGCLHALMELLRSKRHLSCQPLGSSVLFALINMASRSFQCVQDMLDNQMFELVQMLFKTIDAQSSMTFDLAWLINSIYSREETFDGYSEQYPSICGLVQKRLSELLHLESKNEKERVLVPFLHCLANMMAIDAQLAKTTLENHPSSLSSFACLLMSKSEIVVQETLRMFINSSVSLCCRVLMSFHPKLCPAIVSLCHHTNACLALQALTLMDNMTRTSSFVDCHLIGQGVIAKLVPLLQPGNRNDGVVTDAALVVVKNLLSSCPQAEEELKGLYTQLQ